jgi:hypothetical protein
MRWCVGSGLERLSCWFAAHLRESVQLDCTAPLVVSSHAHGVLGERLFGLRVDPLLDGLAEAQCLAVVCDPRQKVRTQLIYAGHPSDAGRTWLGEESQSPQFMQRRVKQALVVRWDVVHGSGASLQVHLIAAPRIDGIVEVRVRVRVGLGFVVFVLRYGFTLTAAIDGIVAVLYSLPFSPLVFVRIVRGWIVGLRCSASRLLRQGQSCSKLEHATQPQHERSGVNLFVRCSHEKYHNTNGVV